jgi:DNA invertase Pin-like site-specific DNA recombinase
MLGVFAEFETNLRRERQFEGIAKALKIGRASATATLAGRVALRDFLAGLAKEESKL